MVAFFWFGDQRWVKTDRTSADLAPDTISNVHSSGARRVSERQATEVSSAGGSSHTLVEQGKRHRFGSRRLITREPWAQVRQAAREPGRRRHPLPAGARERGAPRAQAQAAGPARRPARGPRAHASEQGDSRRPLFRPATPLMGSGEPPAGHTRRQGSSEANEGPWKARSLGLYRLHRNSGVLSQDRRQS